MYETYNLRDAIIKAWDRTQPCPDGYKADFCPSCLYASLWLVLQEQETKIIAMRTKEAIDGQIR